MIYSCKLIMTQFGNMQNTIFTNSVEDAISILMVVKPEAYEIWEGYYTSTDKQNEELIARHNG